MTDHTLAATEAAVVAMVGKAYMPPETMASAPEVTIEADKFEFDADFQTKITTHVLRDQDFMRKVAHLIKPEYFDNAGEAAIVNMALRFFAKFNSVPSPVTATALFKMDRESKVIRDDTRGIALDAMRAVYSNSADVGSSAFVAERVAEFARHQAVTQAILQSVDLLEKKQFDRIEEKIKIAVGVGINADSGEYDYFAKIEERTQERADRKLGIAPPTGITTGHTALDNLLYHKGWGRKELSVLLGGAKSGKTTGLVNFARAGALAGKKVLYVTLEVSAKILAERLDAAISDTYVKELLDRMHEVNGKIRMATPKDGCLKIHEFPSGSFTPNMLRALIERYKSPAIMPDGSVRDSIIFDLIVVDYADIMAPNQRTQDSIENSKSVYLDLRAIAFEENVAMLSATQGNRAGASATVLKAEHIADDYNKVRTVDIMISINMTDEERAEGICRLFFAASRNQEGGFTVFIKQDLAKMQFITSIVRVE